ncbi:palmitoyltransferase ZDHHC19-like [Marmota monax]|uniref:palmitoyltransferase ZDHHC19-like n=1 Tax=Marmota monax TaxID=9995 RepID=UPI001EB07A8A|nr:palmitoyltransferase ZDHHC19-like [Marmota monax]
MVSNVSSPSPITPARYGWLLPSLLASFNVAALATLSVLFFSIPCRALAQSGEWALPVATGLLCLLSFYSLICMNISDPGILHRGSVEQNPEASYVAHLNNKCFPMPWCAKCHLHRLPRTYHCENCNICVEEFDHHCRWINNCVGHRNIRLYLLLLLSLCLYLGAVLASCVVFLVHRRHIPFMDRALSIIVAIPSAGFLLPLILQLLIKARAVSTARRPYETQSIVRDLDKCIPLSTLHHGQG